MSGRTERCSTCATPIDEALVLIATPRELICDKCVEICMEIVTKKKKAARMAFIGEAEYASWFA